jgi:hypothetical protein
MLIVLSLLLCLMAMELAGLDARAAAIVMNAIRNVASSGRTVMVTIHQPSIEIFEAFDTLLLLQRGGRTTYFGPLGQESSLLVAYLLATPGDTWACNLVHAMWLPPGSTPAFSSSQRHCYCAAAASPSLTAREVNGSSRLLLCPTL